MVLYKNFFDIYYNVLLLPVIWLVTYYVFSIIYWSLDLETQYNRRRPNFLESR